MGKIARDETLEKVAKATEAIAAALAGSSPEVLDSTFEAMLDGTNTTKIFHHWWPLARGLSSEENRYATLCRFFEMLAEAWEGKRYTLRFNDYRVSGLHAATPLDDLADKVAAMCATEQSLNVEEWCDEDPMTWYVRFNGLSLTDGTMNVLAVEGVDDTFDITGNTAPVYTGRLGLWKTQYSDGTYEYKTFATRKEGNLVPWAGDVAPDGSHRVMNWEATFGGSNTSGGKLTSGSGYHGGAWVRNGNVPAWRTSAASGLTNARKWDNFEGLFSDTDLEVILDLWQLRHFDLENSGILEGCLDYNYQYTVAAAEEGVTSVLLSTANAANLVVGGCVEVGSHPSGTNTDRNTAANYDLVGCAVITAIESVTVDDTTLARVHLDLASSVDIPATAYVSTMPWVPGSTEHLPGHKDGSLYNCTNGKTPARIAGVEIIDGAYAIGLDPLWDSSWDATRTPKSIYTIYQVRDSINQGGSVTSEHENVGQFTFGAGGWQYIKHLEIRDDGMYAPEEVGGAATTYMKSAFFVGASSGVRCPWRFCALDDGAPGGLAGAAGSATPSDAYGGGRPRLSGSGKKRGEWAA